MEESNKNIIVANHNEPPLPDLTKLNDNQIKFFELMIPRHFNITMIMREIGIDRNQFYSWLKHNPRFKEQYENSREYLIDKAEEVLLKAMEEGDAKSAQFILKALSNKYKDKIDVTSNGKTIGNTIINILPPIDNIRQQNLDSGEQG